LRAEVDLLARQREEILRQALDPQKPSATGVGLDLQLADQRVKLVSDHPRVQVVPLSHSILFPLRCPVIPFHSRA